MKHFLLKTNQHLHLTRKNKCETSNSPANLWVLWYRLAQPLQGAPDEQMKKGDNEEKKGEEEKKSRDETIVHPDRAQISLAVDPGGQLDLRNTLWGLLLYLSLTPIRDPVLESSPAGPQRPHVYVCFGGLVAPTFNQRRRTRLREAGSRGSF